MRIATVAALAALIGPAGAAAQTDLPPEQYGRLLVTETFAYLGPEAPDPDLRLAGNNLACSNCHVAGGLRPGGLPLTAAYAAYPAYVARSGAVETIEDRVDGCMTRSMNGRPLPVGSREMTAIVAYLQRLPDDEGAPTPLVAPLPELDRAADPARGARLYAAVCAACHGADGAGRRNGVPGDALGYLHPPLWGPDSFNDGAGMGRLITAATFVHTDMPATATPSAPSLTPEDAWDIAAHVIAQPRPQIAGLEKDYPNLQEKPVDTPYGPWPGDFPADQHRFGPFQPMRDAMAAPKADP